MNRQHLRDLFTDQELDPESGLYNYDARLYDPVIGRFISPDTIIPDYYDPRTLNRYSYCRNNPLIYVDPSGLEQINVFYMINVSNKSFNEWALNLLVNNPSAIETAAKEAGKTYAFDDTGKLQEVNSAYKSNDTEVIVIVAHGAKGKPLIQDVEGADITPADFDSSTKGKSLINVYILACHQNNYENDWEASLDVNVETYDKGNYLWFWDINDAINNTIPGNINDSSSSSQSNTSSNSPNYIQWAIDMYTQFYGEGYTE